MKELDAESKGLFAGAMKEEKKEEEKATPADGEDDEEMAESDRSDYIDEYDRHYYDEVDGKPPTRIPYSKEIQNKASEYANTLEFVPHAEASLVRTEGELVLIAATYPPGENEPAEGGEEAKKDRKGGNIPYSILQVKNSTADPDDEEEEAGKNAFKIKVIVYHCDSEEEQQSIVE